MSDLLHTRLATIEARLQDRDKDMHGCDGCGCSCCGDLRTLLAIARRCVEALEMARAGLIATSLGGISDEDGRETALQSWCDEGWTCEHAECVKGRAGIEVIDQTLADLARMGEGREK